MSVGEFDLRPVLDPEVAYRDMILGDLKLPQNAQLQIDRQSEVVTDPKRASEVFAQYGAVVLGASTIIAQTEREALCLSGFTDKLTNYAIDRLNDPELFEATLQKDYGAYNDTERHLFTVSYQNVVKHLPNVLKWQRNLLPLVRQINGDPTTEISTDEAEGTVINLQLFAPDADPDFIQQHGAHTDRVDTTVVTCLDNIGPNGNLVFVDGYFEACEGLDLSPHQRFYANIAKIIANSPDSVVFRVHPVVPGAVIVLKSAKDIHFISKKTYRDVQAGMAQGQTPRYINGKILGRGITNNAFETAECRSIDAKAKALEANFGINDDMDKTKLFAVLDQALETVHPDERRAIGNAIITRVSAEDLYHESA